LADSINTHYVKRGFATSEDIVLSETPKTRTVFRPGLHAGGVRGQIIRQKIGADGAWKEVNEVNFNRLDPDCGVAVELDTEATTKLFEKLQQLYEVQRKGVPYGDESFVVGKPDEVVLVDDQDKAKAFNAILEQGYSEDFWEALNEKNPDLGSRLAMAKIQLDRQAAIKEFRESLSTHAGEEPYWQDFFSKHPWIIQAVFSTTVFVLAGETYLGGKLPVGRQGKGGVATDFLTADESTKSFSVVDIKTPATPLVGQAYRGQAGSGNENESYSMHAELSGGIVQVRNQITVAGENFESVLGKGFEQLNRLHPKGVLIAGTLSGLSRRQRESFNQFRYGLFSLTVITYDEVLSRLEVLFRSESTSLPKTVGPAAA
jgi:Domain of unknown function (DUF4263)